MKLVCDSITEVKRLLFKLFVPELRSRRKCVFFVTNNFPLDQKFWFELLEIASDKRASIYRDILKSARGIERNKDCITAKYRGMLSVVNMLILM